MLIHKPKGNKSMRTYLSRIAIGALAAFSLAQGQEPSVASGNETQGYGVLFTCASLAYLIAYALNRYLCPSFAPMAEIPAPLAAPSR